MDFIFEDRVAIQVKGKQRLSNEDFRGLKAIEEEGIAQKLILVCLEARERDVNGIRVLPWQQFLQELWTGLI